LYGCDGDGTLPVLAYVQWFSELKPHPEPDIKMYMVRRLRSHGQPRGSVVRLDSILRPIQLIPKFGKTISPDMTSDNVLDVGEWYYVNSFWDKETYMLLS